MQPYRILLLDVKHSQILSFTGDKAKITTVIAGCGGSPDGVAYDAENDHIYWTNMGNRSGNETFDQNDGFIERADLVGANRKVLICPGKTFTPKQLKLDLANKWMYWCDREGMRVMRANLDGSNLITLIQTGGGDQDRKDETRHCVGIALDMENNHMYWTQKGPVKGGLGRIFRAGLAFSSTMDPSNRDDIELLWNQLPEPIDLELITSTAQLYWTDRGAPPNGNTLNLGNVENGPGQQPEILASGLHEAIGLALDIPNDRLFFSDLGGTLYTSRLNGSECQVLLAGDFMFTGMALIA
jgi:hypothetical protein